MGASLLASAVTTLNNVLLAQEDESFIGSTMFFVLCSVVVVGLGGLLYYMRVKQQSDE